MSVLNLIDGRNEVPTAADRTKLPGGGKLGAFWMQCKNKRRCDKSAYARLLTNPVLKADYHAITAAREIPKEIEPPGRYFI